MHTDKLTSAPLPIGRRSRAANRLVRLIPIAFGIVVVLGKGTRGAPPGPASEQAPRHAVNASQTASPDTAVDAPTAGMSALVIAANEAASGEPSASPTPATTAASSATAPGKPKPAPSPWRGSEIAVRNAMTALTVDPSAELTYNPYWAVALEVAPRFAFGDFWSLSASLEIQREITQADDSTLANETLLGDLGLRVSASRFAKIPGADIDVSAALGLTLPTSLSSQGDTLLFALSPSLRLSKTFDKVLDGLTLGYSLRFTKLFHRFTTSELASPIVPGCFSGDSDSCDRFLNTGYRNATFRLSNGVDVGLDLADWLSFSGDFSIIVSWLHASIDDERVSHIEVEPTGQRFALAADLGFSGRWWKPLEVRLGASTFNPQLSPDGGRYAPFFNRFTTLYLDLRLDVVALFSAPTEEN